MMLLLDTHAWVWSMAGDATRIGRKARRTLERAAARDELRVSPVSVFEITALASAGRVRFSQSAEQWLRDALAEPGLRVAEFSVDIAIDAGHIPRIALNDPIDRLLVATARKMQATLLTADRAILDYAEVSRGVRVSDAGR